MDNSLFRGCTCGVRGQKGTFIYVDTIYRGNERINILRRVTHPCARPDRDIYVNDELVYKLLSD